jgi:DNA-directed RNA polymerase subunit RPC12/RpoP/1-acyl-sn-glycerol-3-phosphate acyltransferase
MEVNYRNKKRYKTAKYPKRQGKFWTWLIWFLSKIMLRGKKFTLETIDMEGLQPPYIIFSNHMEFIDFELATMVTYPHKVNNVVNIDGYLMMPFLLEWIGAICTRKFTNDIHLVKSIRKVIQRGDVLCLYPEARYTPIGTTSFLPDSLGRLVKMNKVPLVVVTHHGNHLYSPTWNYAHKRKVPMHTVFRQVLTAQQVEEMSVEEINAVIHKAMAYDEYQYLLESGHKLTEPFRAEGLHKVLYQCPHCGREFEMDTKGAELFCKHCGKRWFMEENGQLRALDGETEFAHIPHWYAWQRQQVRAQIEKGEYVYEDTVDIYGLPRCWRFIPLGKAKVRHDATNGWVLEGHYRGQDYRIVRPPKATNSLHVEYDFHRLRKENCFDISTEDDSYYCYPTNPLVVTKLALATEEIYKLKTGK